MSTAFLVRTTKERRRCSLGRAILIWARRSATRRDGTPRRKRNFRSGAPSVGTKTGTADPFGKKRGQQCAQRGAAGRCALLRCRQAGRQAASQPPSWPKPIESRGESQSWKATRERKKGTSGPRGSRLRVECIGSHRARTMRGPHGIMPGPH